MENSLQKKALMILSGLAILPSLAAAESNPVKNVQACSPYNAYCHEEEQTADESSVTGLSEAELKEAKTLVHELNQADVIAVREMNLTRAKSQPYRYNLPTEEDLELARVANLQRLAKLREIVKASK